MDLNSRHSYLVIFDLDGVIVDTTALHLKAWESVTKEFGIPFDPAISDALRGISRRQSLMIILGEKKLPESAMNDLMDKKNECYKKYISLAEHSLILPGVKQFLAELHALGFKLAVASSSKNAKHLLKQTHLDEDFFDVVIDGNDVKRGKPNPELFLLTAKKSGIIPTPCNTLVIEDSQAGIEAAKRANMGTMGVGTAQLEGCDIRLPSLEDIPTAYVENYFSTC